MTKRTLINDLPWQEIQSFYDIGMSWRDLREKFRISFKTLQKAKRLKLFVSRDGSTAALIMHERKPRVYPEVRRKRSAFTNYRADCAFKFNLSDYPDEFNFSLIEQHGWYKASNRGNNLTGISRDHIVSVRHGFDNNIDSSLISHPANCQIIPHRKNQSKNKKSIITLIELEERIKKFNKQHLEMLDGVEPS